MEGSTSTAVLVDAKREYLAQLSDYVSPVILAIVNDMWDACKGQKQPLIAFMTKLKGVPDVNNATISAWTSRVSDKCPWLSELLAAVFVSYVKVLTSVRLGNVKPRIKLKVPSNETFIHSVMVDYAHDLYGDPYLIQRTDTEAKAARMQLVRKSIEANVRNLLPVKDILNAYVSSTSMHNREFEPEPHEESEEEPEELPDESKPDDTPDHADEVASQHQPDNFSSEEPPPYQEPLPPTYTEAPQPAEPIAPMIQGAALPDVSKPVVAQPVVTQPVVTQPVPVQEHRTVPLGKPVGYEDAEELE